MSHDKRSGMETPELRLRAALNATDQAIMIADADGGIVEVNDALLALSRVSREQVVGRNVLDLSRQRGGDQVERDRLAAVLLGEEVAPFDLERTDPDGIVRHFRITLTPVRDARGAPAGLTAVIADTAMVRRMEAERQHTDARTRFLADASKVLAGSLDLDRTLQTVIDLIVPTWTDACAIALVDDDGTMHQAAWRHIDPDQTGLAFGLLPNDTRPPPGGFSDQAIRGRRSVLLEHFDPDVLADPRSGTAARELGLLSALFTPLVVREEVVGLLVAATSTASHRRLGPQDAALFDDLAGRAAQAIDNARLMRAMTITEARFRTAFDHAPIGIALLTRGAGDAVCFAEVNPAISAILGYPRDQLVGHRVDDFIHPEHRLEELRRLQWLLGGAVQELSGESRMVRADGETRWVLTRAARIDGGVLVAQIQDVTEQRRSQEQLQHLASHDALTGVLNRRRFQEELEATLGHVRRHGDSAAVVTLDVDNFKHVNDTYGHTVGDELLRACAGALLDRVRLTDSVGRLGGDEFGVILRRTPVEDARTVAHQLLEHVRSVGVRVGERMVRVTASAGLRPLDDADERSADELLTEADMAMYEAKERGRDRLSLIEPGDQQPERVRARMRWSERIRDALEDDGFVLYEQPILRLEGDRLDRSELLIRMLGQDAQPIAPAAFLPVAERYGQIQAIDRWVVHNAIKLLADRRAVAAEWQVEVNLSGDSLTEPAVVDYIEAEIRNAPIDPRNLVFEVTETAAISNLERARTLAGRLAELGCRFALDDFGAGFASFAYLKHLPLDVIKIDGEFIRSLLTSHHDQVTVQAIVDIARGLGKETVAEFVEDAATLEALRRLGVDCAQGYHVGRPQPALVTPAFG